MSVADDIRKVNTSYYNQKMPETLDNMSLNEMSSVWHNIQASQKKSENASSTENADALTAQKNSIKKIATPDVLLRKIQEYTASLMMGDFNIEDFAKINEFCKEFIPDGASEELKKSYENLKEKMSDKKLSLTNNITIDAQRKNPLTPEKTPNYPIENVDSIIISGNQEIINALPNKKLRNGKNILFQNAEGTGLAEVAFDKDGNAELFLPSEDSYKTYRLNNKGQLSQVNEDGSETIFSNDEMNNLQPEDKKALDCIISANVIWKKYTHDELDYAIGDNARDDNIQVNESERKEPTKINEGKSSIKINETPATTKAAPNKTVIKETPELDDTGKEMSTGEDDIKDQTDKEDEVYWKEQDIIQAMFEKWFLAAANSATNWVVHQCEYVMGAVWNQFEKDYNQRAAERKEQKAPEEAKTPKTDNVYNEIYNIHDQNMQSVRQNCTSDEITNQLKEGKSDELIANNPYINKLYNSSPEFLNKMLAPEKLSDPQYAENVSALMRAFIAKAEEFSNKYAVTSMLDNQMNNQNAFNNQTLSETYQQHQQMGLDILMKDIKETHEINPKLTLGDAVNDACDRISKAEKTAVKDYKQERCDENGKKPHKNKELEEFNELIRVQDKPRTLEEEAAHQNAKDEKNSRQTQETKDEAATLKDREEYIRSKQKLLEEYKAPRKAKPIPKNLDISKLKYVRDYNSK